MLLIQQSRKGKQHITMEKPKAVSLIRNKSTISSSAAAGARRVARSPIPSPDPLSQRKTLSRTTSDLSRTTKTAQQASAAPAAKCPLTKKPTEKWSPSSSAPRTSTLPTSKAKPALRTTTASSALQKPAVPSRPAERSSKMSMSTVAKTVVKSQQLLNKSRSSSSLQPKRKEAEAGRVVRKPDKALAVAPVHKENEHEAKAEKAAAVVTEVAAVETENAEVSAEEHQETVSQAVQEPGLESRPEPELESRSEPELESGSEPELEPKLEPEYEPEHEPEAVSREHEGESGVEETNNELVVKSEPSEVVESVKNVDEVSVQVSDTDKCDTEAKAEVVAEVEKEVTLVVEANAKEVAAVEAPMTIAPVPVEETVETPAVVTPLTISKKPEVIQGKRTETPKSNAIIEETRSKLLVSRKSKVLALADAFESIMT